MYEFDKHPSDIWGLKYIPVLTNHSMDNDGPPNCVLGKSIPNIFGFQDIDKNTLKEHVLLLGDKLRYVLEIGVSLFTNEEVAKGSTYVVMEEKSPGTKYLGVDISDHGGWVKEYGDSHFMVCDSENEQVIHDQMKQINMPEIDLYLIDGWHSVNKVLKEWRYTKWLSNYGSVVMHDVSCHPCGLVFDAIDETLFDKKKYESDHSWGLGIATRR